MALVQQVVTFETPAILGSCKKPLFSPEKKIQIEMPLTPLTLSPPHVLTPFQTCQ